jgi:Asp-tRNA(Asn)/Glu-tRNA(Gln) amidotransferase A subunit family amidase
MAIVTEDIRRTAKASAVMESVYDAATFRGATFFDAVPRFRSGEDDPRKYLERCLEVIAIREPLVKAWVVLNERGAREAADASAARWRSGKPLSPIDGMPIGIKDLIETKDMPTQMGCAAMEGNFPKRDSALVRALRDAGAVIVGKAVTTELGGAHPGPTTNPFDSRRTPGGSSSGSAAAVDQAHLWRAQPRRAPGLQPERDRCARKLADRHVAGGDGDCPTRGRRSRASRSVRSK